MARPLPALDLQQVATATEKIDEARAQLAKIDTIKKLADGIQKNVGKIEGECTSLNSGIRRLLDQALAALGTDSTGSADEGLEGDEEGVA